MKTGRAETTVEQKQGKGVGPQENGEEGLTRLSWIPKKAFQNEACKEFLILMRTDHLLLGEKGGPKIICTVPSKSYHLSPE